jgi:hypothetical protein
MDFRALLTQAAAVLNQIIEVKRHPALDVFAFNQLRQHAGLSCAIVAKFQFPGF